MTQPKKLKQKTVEDAISILKESVKLAQYGLATKYPRKCFYEPQCIRGYIDELLGIFKLLFWKPY